MVVSSPFSGERRAASYAGSVPMRRSGDRRRMLAHSKHGCLLAIRGGEWVALEREPPLGLTYAEVYIIALILY
jgi:hypothetical protein